MYSEPGCRLNWQLMGGGLPGGGTEGEEGRGGTQLKTHLGSFVWARVLLSHKSQVRLAQQLTESFPHGLQTQIQRQPWLRSHSGLLPVSLASALSGAKPPAAP